MSECCIEVGRDSRLAALAPRHEDCCVLHRDHMPEQPLSRIRDGEQQGSTVLILRCEPKASLEGRLPEMPCSDHPGRYA